MTEKSHIVEALGERGLLLPALVNRALAANDQAKYRLTLLQTAKAHADHPDSPSASLRREREVSGVQDPGLDAVVAGSGKLNGDTYRVPQAQQICSGLADDVRTMLAPFQARQGDSKAVELSARFGKLSEQLRAIDQDRIDGCRIDAITSANRRDGDSLHLLIMDLHKALNKLQAGIAAESIDEAKAYGIGASDRALVQAFMRGVNRTAPLKFDHPGLATTATRIGDKLVLQNDIGTTDAHVLVVHVAGDEVTVTYTDVHLLRLLFFHSLFEAFDVDWQDTLSRTDKAVEDGVYHLSIGTFKSKESAQRDAFLDFLGSRLVFLIDWNRARKRLRTFVGKSDAIGLLKWAADNSFGHMAFLRAGGEQLVYDALEFVVKGPFRFGERLSDMLGEEPAIQYLKFVLKTCAEGLLQGRQESLIQDEIRAELFNYFRSARHGLLEIAAEHAALIVEIAAGLRDGLLRLSRGDAGAHLEHNAARAKEWESRADDLVNRARSAVKQADSGRFYCELVESADDVADELEEAAFHLTLASVPMATGSHEPLQSLTGLLVQGAQEYVKVLETARFVRRGAAREDMQDFLEAIHRIMAVEHQTDKVERGVEAALVAGAQDFRQLHVLIEAAKNLEQAADGLMHVALKVRDHFLGQVMTP
jgi:uncharacterized protein Yka (UPF0111/DUF47 family)